MNLSSIEWTDFTSNPLRYRDLDGNIVHACIHKSTGCIHCYAEVMARRWGRAGRPFTAENIKRLTPFLDEKELHHMRTYKPAAGKRCFVGDMTDIFGEWVPFELLDPLFAVFALRADVTWQLLTKRPERMREYLTAHDIGARVIVHVRSFLGANEVTFEVRTRINEIKEYGLPNVWLGTSTENQDWFDRRIDSLLKTPAAVRFISYEPALGPLAVEKCLNEVQADENGLRIPKLDWIIIGGESGPGARPFNLQWPRDVIAQCEAAGVPVFVKQLGARPIDDYGLQMDHVRFKLVLLKDRKGGDMAEWPEVLRVREFPG